MDADVVVRARRFWCWFEMIPVTIAWTKDSNENTLSSLFASFTGFAMFDGPCSDMGRCRDLCQSSEMWQTVPVMTRVTNPSPPCS